MEQQREVVIFLKWFPLLTREQQREAACSLVKRQFQDDLANFGETYSDSDKHWQIMKERYYKQYHNELPPVSDVTDAMMQKYPLDKRLLAKMLLERLEPLLGKPARKTNLVFEYEHTFGDWLMINTIDLHARFGNQVEWIHKSRRSDFQAAPGTIPFMLWSNYSCLGVGIGIWRVRSMKSVDPTVASVEAVCKRFMATFPPQLAGLGINTIETQPIASMIQRLTR